MYRPMPPTNDEELLGAIEGRATEVQEVIASIGQKGEILRMMIDPGSAVTIIPTTVVRDYPTRVSAS